LWGTLPLLGIQNFDKNVATFKEPERCCNLKNSGRGLHLGVNQMALDTLDFTILIAVSTTPVVNPPRTTRLCLPVVV